MIRDNREEESGEGLCCLVPDKPFASRHLEDQGAGHRLWEVQTKTHLVQIEGAELEYLGLWLDNKLDWTINTNHLYRKG